MITIILLDTMGNDTAMGIDVWSTRYASRPTVRHLLVFLTLILLGTILGALGSLSMPVGFAVTGFWPAIIIQVLGGIWFGMLGVLAGVIFPFFSNTIAGAPLEVSIIYAPSNFLQGFIPAIAFRKLKLDPCLRRPRDIFHFLWAGVLVNNLLGASLSVVILMVLGYIRSESLVLFLVNWIIGNGVPAFLLGSALLYLLSPVVIRSKVFCRGWWA